MKIIDEIGARYGRLIVIEYYGKNANRAACWLCKCDCGKQAIVTGTSLRQKRSPTKSCGCLSHDEVTRAARGASRATHGMTQYGGKRPSCYNVWANMRARCLCKTSKDWFRYGGRGITICKEWDDFAKFFEDMGHRPPSMSLDRIDNNGSYCKENCRWTTPKVQRYNQRPYGSSVNDYINYQTGLQFITALIGPQTRIHA